MKLSDINEKTPLVSVFAKRLAKSAKQAVPFVNVLKVSRVGGASSRPVEMILENGQSVKIYLRSVDEGEKTKLDLFRIDINGKQVPLAGDFDLSYEPAFNISVDQIGQMIIRGQKAFYKKQATESKRTKGPTKKRAAPKNKSQQLSALRDQVIELDKVIEEKQAEKTQLETQLKQIKDQIPG